MLAKILPFAVAAIPFFACGARTSGLGLDDFGVDGGAVLYDAAPPIDSGADVTVPRDAGQDVPDAKKLACPGVCSSIGAPASGEVHFADVSQVGPAIAGRWRACNPSLGIGPDNGAIMELDLRGADGTARFFTAAGTHVMDVGAHVNVIDHQTTLFSLDLDSAAYALHVWDCPNGVLSFGGFTVYDVTYAAMP